MQIITGESSAVLCEDTLEQTSHTISSLDLV